VGFHNRLGNFEEMASSAGPENKLDRISSYVQGVQENR